MNEEQRQAKWALEDWAEGAGSSEWKVVPARPPGEAYHLKRNGSEILYCGVPNTHATTTVLIHGAAPADLESLNEVLSDAWRSPRGEARDGTRVHVAAREMAKLASWNRQRLG